MLAPHQHHFRLLILLLLFSLHENQIIEPKGFLDFLLSPCKCRCGVPNREARFLGGEYLRGHEFPWLVSIQIPGFGEHELLRTIPGTLINNKYVITSASTILGLTSEHIKVSFGQFDRCAPETSSLNVSVDRVLVHPDYSPENKANDLALLKLSTAVLIERRVAPICLSVPGHSYLGQVATIAGWPKPHQEIIETCRPKKIGLPVLDSNICSEKHEFSADKGCVGVIDAPGVVCEEDAGGPVMYRSHKGVYELLGVLTNQHSCEQTTRGVGLYTKINQHLSWIVKNTKDACYCIKT